MSHDVYVLTPASCILPRTEKHFHLISLNYDLDALFLQTKEEVTAVKILPSSEATKAVTTTVQIRAFGISHNPQPFKG